MYKSLVLLYLYNNTIYYIPLVHYLYIRIRWAENENINKIPFIEIILYKPILFVKIVYSICGFERNGQYVMVEF